MPKIEKPDSKPTLPKERHVQLFWMIWAPLIFATLLILAAAVMVALPVTATNVDTSSLGSLSFVWISTPWFILLLVIVAIAGVKIFLIAKLLQILPGYLHMAQFYANFVAHKTKEFADHLVRPVITVKAHQSSLELAAHKIGIKTGQQE